MQTPPVSGTDAAIAAVSSALPMMPSPSRSHCTAAPATNTLPSIAKSASARGEAARVDTSRFRDTAGRPPVCRSAKHPVPYVFFAWPARKHAWPASAACWSPAIPAISTGAPNRAASVSPTTPDDATIRGSIARGTPNKSSISPAQSPVSRFMSMVREAFVTSVACTAPPVRFQMSHVSTVPNSRSPAEARAGASGTLSRIQRILLAEKYASTMSPVARDTASAAGDDASAAQ